MKLLRVLFILGLVVGIGTLAMAEGTGRIATVKELSGNVEAKIANGAWSPATVGMTLKQGDAIRTGDNSMALLMLDGPAESASVEVKKGSQLTIAELTGDKAMGTEKTLLDLALGEILIKAKKLHSEKSKFEVKTPTSIVGVRGTTFSVTVEAVE